LFRNLRPRRTALRVAQTSAPLKVIYSTAVNLRAVRDHHNHDIDQKDIAVESLAGYHELLKYHIGKSFNSYLIEVNLPYRRLWKGFIELVLRHVSDGFCKVF
jgi:hypothetical protein